MRRRIHDVSAAASTDYFAVVRQRWTMCVRVCLDNEGQHWPRYRRIGDYFFHVRDFSRFQHFENPYKVSRMYPLSTIAINCLQSRLDKIIIDVNELSDFLVRYVN